MAIISLCEYGKLRIGEFDATYPSVTIAQAKILGNLKQTYGFDVFRRDGEIALSARQYVGAVQAGSLTVEILPKIEGIDGVAIRRNLIAMLSIAWDLDISAGDVAQVSTQNRSILEILIHLFCKKLSEQVRRGLVRRYEVLEENLRVLRGKLSISHQMRLNASHPEQLYCRFDDFREDNPLNQVLKAAIRLLLKQSRSLRNLRTIQKLLSIFENVSDIPGPTLLRKHVAFDRLNDRYKPCFKLARMFLKDSPPDVTGGRHSSFSLFFDMNNLFENYIGNIAKRALNSSDVAVHLQGPQRHVAIDESTHRDAFAMRPDIVGLRGGGVAWILDTKWKELSREEAQEGVAQSDLYQMYAYANCYGCEDVVLLYPHHSNLGPTAGVRSSYLASNGWNRLSNLITNRARIRVATISLRDLHSVPEQLKRIFAQRATAQDSNVARLELLRDLQHSVAPPIEENATVPG